ncbi:hypothetical protein MPH_13692 [Macrophomina phaseolina MS6]|uniref:Uncharacterized protein n=1 Tax=Macrophomina phaseolina (strain MS6) TaxID=1126212 RepID=K2RGQ1_MACPH|nr:hypothetical protein MPH_13692 [Macrophomina phaseolina MS6]
MSQYEIRNSIRSNLEPIDYRNFLQALQSGTTPGIEATDTLVSLNILNFLFRNTIFRKIWERQFNCSFLLYGHDLETLRDYLEGKLEALTGPLSIALAMVFGEESHFIRAVFNFLVLKDLPDIYEEVRKSIRDYVSMYTADGKIPRGSVVLLHLQLQVVSDSGKKIFQQGENGVGARRIVNKERREFVPCLTMCGHATRPIAVATAEYDVLVSPDDVCAALGLAVVPSWHSMPRCCLCEEDGRNLL